MGRALVDGGPVRECGRLVAHVLGGLLAIALMFIGGAVVWASFWLALAWCCIERGSVLGGW